ncbi:hypothetical protein [Curvibacter sp. AEP1-3]|uniref:hypothetical protein n=1 Tax=Curvibacter sp. AEP1-3 TaxID=1844971 RepID=UPI0012F9C041|nr:hypothetical protein [Curvibacter sp. AEP1-3]
MRKINRDFSNSVGGNYESSNGTPRISVFPQDQSHWRIDWFGDIAFPDRSVRRKQPSVFLHLSRLADERFRSDPSVLLHPQCTGPAKLQRRIWVSVGTLALVRIGDIWHKGGLALRPDYELEEFASLQVDPGSTAIVKAGLNLNNEGFLLPISEHPWHIQCTQSYCLMVQLPHDRRLIIPCVELARFYFGSSSGLISRLFLPPLFRDALFSSASLDPYSRRLQIDLADKMSGASAADIGRIAMDPIAARAARIVGNSCLRASTAGLPIYPQARFPFEGKTNLIASGRWLSHGGVPKSTFLVYNLRSCSHPFPFRSLQYTTKGAQPRPKLPNQARSPTEEPRILRSSAPEVKNPALVEKDASSKLAGKTRQVRELARFPDLERKSIWRSMRLMADESATEHVNSGAPTIDSMAVGEPGSGRRVRPVELSVVSAKASGKQEVIPLFLQDTVEDLKQLKGLTVELLTESLEDGWTVPISVLANSDGEVAPELMIDCPEHGLRMRKAAVFAFKRKSEHLCAVVIEANPPHTKIIPTTGQDENEVWLTLRCAAVDFSKAAPSDTLDAPLAELISWVFDEEDPV